MGGYVGFGAESIETENKVWIPQDWWLFPWMINKNVFDSDVLVMMLPLKWA